MNATETTRARQRKPRTKPQRSIRLAVRPVDGSVGVVRISVGTDYTDYFVTELATDYGRGFRVEKIDPTAEPAVYDVHLDGDKRSCECKGFGYRSQCRHADGLAALIAAGRL